ncbi:hypothetical protein LOTGIDRAFT_114956 [Lottia gigantea]|uniref:Chitin synthase n=1 Tax=Lottia gigantea TaxID=225164 RepID=V4AUK7_LOTGI|nr:hypothetical protein LOTGIDRAFT_114956 [Lottia gigantea]ESO97456.1 hypothetical protein LOTGIDRAFT_114956 [Lottia gigantea]
MSRYLISLQKLLSSEKLKDIKVESHIFLDNAMELDSLNSYACQLLSLLVDTFNITLSSLVAYRTPYGCQILSHPKADFPVYVHVKDGSKFKVKKRWSQVMYMNYILRYRCSYELDEAGRVKDFLEEPVYILATDADTEFNAKSVSALVELCERDHSLGAACGRTIPIGQQKPMVWYQKFEYAKGENYIWQCSGYGF